MACVPCGHKVMCAECSNQYDQETCPICGSPISNLMRIYEVHEEAPMVRNCWHKNRPVIHSIDVVASLSILSVVFHARNEQACFYSIPDLCLSTNETTNKTAKAEDWTGVHPESVICELRDSNPHSNIGGLPTRIRLSSTSNSIIRLIFNNLAYHCTISDRVEVARSRVSKLGR